MHLSGNLLKRKQSTGAVVLRGNSSDTSVPISHSQAQSLKRCWSPSSQVQKRPQKGGGPRQRSCQVKVEHQG